jgi:hypothetical protein
MGSMTSNQRIYAMRFCDILPLYVAKAERKNRSKDEVIQIICWLTGYDQAGLDRHIEVESRFEQFFAQAPTLHPNRSLIKGLICGIRVENIEDPLVQNVRYLDKLIDDLAKGKTMQKILPGYEPSPAD